MERLQASVDVLDETHIAGWAMDASKPDVALELCVYAQGELLGKATASQFRNDLKRMNFGTGFYGFEFRFNPVLSTDMIYNIEIWTSDSIELKNCRCYLLILGNANGNNKELVFASSSECQGSLDILTRNRLKGWAYDSDTPEASVPLKIYDNGRLIAKIIANQYRIDLENARLGDGCRGFNLFIPGGLTPADAHSIDVTRERDGAQISGSPRHIASLDQEFEIALSGVVETAIDLRREIKLLDILLAKSDELTFRSGYLDTIIKGSLINKSGVRLITPSGFGGGIKHNVILFLTSRSLYTHRVAFSHAVALRRLGHNVIAISCDEIGLTDYTADTHAIADILILGSPLIKSIEDLLYSVGYYLSVIYLNGSEVCLRYINIIRSIAPRLKIIFNASELENITLSQKSRIHPEAVLPDTIDRTRLREMMGAWEADFIIVQNKTYLRAFPGTTLQDKLKQVAVYMEPYKKISLAESRVGVCLISDVNYPPIQDAIGWFVSYVIPKIRSKNDNINFTVIGNNIPRSIIRVARENSVATAMTDNDYRPELNEFRVSIIPLRYGNMIGTSALDCFGLGVPCVMTPIASEGLELSDELSELVAVDEDAIADLVIKLHEDFAYNRRISLAQIDFVAQNYNFIKVARDLEVVLGKIT